MTTAGTQKFGAFARFLGADKAVKASTVEFEKATHQFLHAVHMMPAQELYQLRSFLEKNKKEEALRALESAHLSSQQTDAFRTLINQGNFVQAVELINKQIAEEEGHLVKTAETTSRLMPLILDPAVERIGEGFANVFISRFCASPHELLRRAHKSVLSLTVSLELGQNPSVETRKGAAQDLKNLTNQHGWIFQKEPLSQQEQQAFQKLQTLLLSEEELTREDLEEGLPFLTKRYEAVAGVVTRLLDSAFEVGGRLITETFQQFTPSSTKTTAPSAVSVLLNGVTHDTTDQELFVNDYEPLITQQTTLLGYNSSCFTLAQIIVESIGGVPVPDRTVIGWIQNSQQDSAVFRSTVFGALDRASFLRRICAKIAYFVLSPLIHFYSQQVTHNLVSYVVNLIKTNSLDGYGEMLTNSITCLNEHAADLNEAYNIIADRGTSKGPAQHPSMTGTVAQRLEQELSFPAYREGMTTQEFYCMLSSSLVDRFAPSFNFSDRLIEIVEGITFAEDSRLRIFNFVLAIPTTVFSIALKAILFIPEMIANFITKFLISWGINRAGVIEQLFESSDPAMRLQGEYSHSLHVLFLKKLKEAWSLMNVPQNSSLDFNELLKSVPEDTREQLRSLVSTFFAVLEKQKAGSENLDKLRQMIDGNAPLQFLQDIGDLFIMQEANAMEKTVDYIAGLLRYLFQERQLLEIVHHGLISMNDQVFAGGSRPTESEMRAVKTELLLMIDKILNKAIRDAVTDKLHPLENYQREANLFVDDLKSAVQIFVGSMTGSFQTGNKQRLLTCWQEFCVARADALSDTEGRRNMSEDSEPKLNKISLELAAILGEMHDPILTLANEEALQLIREFIPRLTQEDLLLRDQIEISLSSLSSVFVRNLKSLESAPQSRQLAYQIRLHSASINHALHQLIGSLDALTSLELLKSIFQSREPLTSEVLQDTLLPIPTLREIERLAQMGQLTEEYFQTAEEAYQENIRQAKQILLEASQAIEMRLPLSSHDQTAGSRLQTSLHQLLVWKDKLAYIECEETSPITKRLAPISGPIVHNICQQIKQRTHMIPKFLRTSYNWRGFLTRFGLAFLRQNG